MIAAARKAGRRLIRDFGELENLQVSRKGPADFVTTADERFNGALRREVLNAEWFSTVKQAQVVIRKGLKQSNHVRPHQALNMRTPVPESLWQNGR